MSITAANAVVMLTLPPIFSAPYQLQQFGADNIFGTDALDAAEESMGVDGTLTAGFINVPTRQTFYLQADSPANLFFDTWYGQQKALQDTFIAGGTILLRSLGIKYKMVRGFLKSYQPLPDAQKTLKERRHTIIWQSATPNPS